MIITLFAAIGENNELGKRNDLIWRIPEDQKRMREHTTGHPIIMGRKTFESMPRALPNRRNIVITRDKNYKAEGGEVVNSLEEALDLIKNEEGEVFIFGGAEIFKLAMEKADRLDITHVYAKDKEADTFFPPIGSEWREVSRDEHEGNPKFAFVIYERK